MVKNGQQVKRPFGKKLEGEGGAGRSGKGRVRIQIWGFLCEILIFRQMCPFLCPVYILHFPEVPVHLEVVGERALKKKKEIITWFMYVFIIKLFLPRSIKRPKMC